MGEFLQVVDEDTQDIFNNLYSKFYSDYGHVSYLISTFPKVLLYGRLLVINGEIIGFVIYGFKPYETSRTFGLFILAVGIEERYQCRGFFTKLVDELKSYGVPIHLLTPERKLGEIFKDTTIAQSIIIE